MQLALVAIMLNEEDYVDRWAQTISRAAEIGCAFDQVVVVDGGSSDRTVEILRARNVDVIVRPFPNHFADQRNFAVDQCDAEWIFELDADEVATTPLLAGLRPIARDLTRSGTDCVGFVRLNFHDGILVAGPGYKGLDYQYRLHHRRCRWIGAVHEEITGYNARFEQPMDDGHFIMHCKTAERFVNRNALYAHFHP